MLIDNNLCCVFSNRLWVRRRNVSRCLIGSLSAMVTSSVVAKDRVSLADTSGPITGSPMPLNDSDDVAQLWTMPQVEYLPNRSY